MKDADIVVHGYQKPHDRVRNVLQLHVQLCQRCDAWAGYTQCDYKHPQGDHFRNDGHHSRNDAQVSTYDVQGGHTHHHNDKLDQLSRTYREEIFRLSMVRVAVVKLTKSQCDVMDRCKGLLRSEQV